jgi:hypothetical protein
VDTALHNAGLPLLSSRGRILLTNVLDMLQDSSSEFLNARLPTMSGEAFTNAAKIGGTDYWNWLTNKTPPFGLGR